MKPRTTRYGRTAGGRFAALLFCLALCIYEARPEAMVQYFNTRWKELADKMPELAEVGFTSSWLPPPQKGSGGLSVGYDHWDPFDFGQIDQRGTVRSRYGTESELLYLMEIAHRFGIRIYFDNIMNHRAFDIPGFNENTPLDVYPGMRPEDFHLRVTEEGFYRKWDNTRDWNDAWQVVNLGLADLIDIAHETPNTNFGTNEGDDHPKISLIRQPDHPEWYLDSDLPLPASNTVSQVGFTVYTFANKEPFEDVGLDGVANTQDTGENNGKFDWTDTDADGQHDASETVHEPFTDTGLDATRPGWNTATYGHGDGIYNMGNPVAEDVGGYLIRAVRYTMDRTHVDGLRLDAVKHVPDYFFGAASDDISSDGYCGQAQMQYNITRGFTDWNNHRDTLFDTEKPRNDALMFGEHLGSPPGFGGYTSRGMRLVDNPLRNHLNGVLGNPSSGLWNLHNPGYSGDPNFNQFTGVMHAQSHDSDYAAVRELQHAYYFTRAGLPLIYTDGNYQSETLGESGGAFPRHANTAFLGQFGDYRVPNLIYIHEQFGRGGQKGLFSDSEVTTYERIDYRESGVDNDGEAVVMCFMMNDNLAAGQYRDVATSFADGSYLWNYADKFGRNDNGFYHTVDGGTISVIIPPGGYFAFSFRTPEPADAWSGPGGKVITLLDGGQDAGFVSYERHDGPNGDPGFNPYGVTDTNSTDYSYTWFVPRIARGTNVDIVVRADGSAENTLIKLDGGIDINSQMGLGPSSGDLRDNPPGIFPLSGSDMLLGYEQPRFVQRVTERFAATNISRNVIGSPGAETFHATIGTAGVTNMPGTNPNDIGAGATATWVFHDPQASVISTSAPNVPQFNPAPELAGGLSVTVSVQVGYSFEYTSLHLYYTTNGSAPEGAGGYGVGATRVAAMSFKGNDYESGAAKNRDWWAGVIPAMPAGADLRYKIGAVKNNSASRFPNGSHNAFWKKQMVTQFEITNLNFKTMQNRPHFDYGGFATGLEDGFHLLSARAFLKRDGLASLYNTLKQTFYLDLEPPQGEIKFPAAGDTIGGEYGMVFRTDRTASDVLVNIEDSDPANDDANTGQSNGNGTNAAGATAWVPASSVGATLTILSDFPEEWRFTYRNVPATGNATIKARLMEISSSTNLNLSDVDGHYNTLTRTVPTLADPIEMYIAFPQTDGETVDSNYVMKVYFDNTLNTNNFTLTINGGAQGFSQFFFNDIGGGLKELGYQLPDLFNGDTNFLHTIVARHNQSGVIRQATRLVKARPTPKGPFVSIVEPTEFDSDGQPTIIELPDVANPTPQDRTFRIRVETDLAAKNVWIEFETNNFVKGYASPVPFIETKLSGAFTVTQGVTSVSAAKTNLAGTVTAVFSNRAIAGAGTLFSNELKIGSAICIGTNASLSVTQILSHTSIEISIPYPGTNVAGVVAALQPLLLSEVSTGDTVKIDTNLLSVSQVPSDSNLVIGAAYPGPTISGAMAIKLDGNPITQGTKKFWDFDWTNMVAGQHRFYARVNTNSVSQAQTNAFDLRTVSVILKELVTNNPVDLDDDDDGILDFEEESAFELPGGNSELWTNWSVKAWEQFGRSDPLSPDSDRDGLTDGLEIGMRTKELQTDTDQNEDTNGDGWKNFLNDLDPPFYNTVPDNGCNGSICDQPGPNYCLQNSPTAFSCTGSRTMRLGGSTTDPLNPDSDYDGIRDGVEDANRNGWLNGDGNHVPGNYDNPNFTEPGATVRTWPDGVRQTGETWTETDPNKSDTDGDGASDGFGEDSNLNGSIAGDVNSNRVYELTEAWTETDPLKSDTDGDGLPDGWENQYSFDPLDNGTNSFRTATPMDSDGTTEHGAEGNPDGDAIIVGVVTNPYVNLLEFQNGTNPRIADGSGDPPEGVIIIGPGDPIGTAAGVTYYQEFLDWDWGDCRILDEYEGDGFNNQQGDINPAYDGFDESRDIVAFYARDGGPSGSGGDDRFYFRLDFLDLKALAEEANLDIYIAIDTGVPTQGERVLPDEVDLLTDMRWELVVAAYKSNDGIVYVDENLGQNTTDFGDNLFTFGGVEARGVGHVQGGFISSYYNSELDSVEIAISRNALAAAPISWNGNMSNLHFQVFTTRDGTCNTCNNGGPGLGDRGGEGDIRDTIYDDYLAEDNYFAKQGIEYIVKSWFSGNFDCPRAQFATVIHGNQAVEPGSAVQDRINTGAGAGFHRPLEIHDVFDVPLGLHVTPTLASAMEWAETDPAITNNLWRLVKTANGPLFNDWIAELVSSNVVDLFASTFSDHMLPYFKEDYNRDNERLAREFLQTLYSTTVTTNALFWTPERVADVDVFGKLLDMGYGYTLIDQDSHMRRWFGREIALGNDGYRPNRIHGVTCFLINTLATDHRFDSDDGGLGLLLRRLMCRKARSSEARQVVTIMSNWEDFESSGNADSYNRNVRWIANHPWIQAVTHEQIAAGQVEPPAAWWIIDRGAGTNAQNKVAHEFIHHSSEENYDRWYDGSGQEESLSNKFFNIRPGVPMPAPYGHQFFGGIVSQAWDHVGLVLDTNIGKVARGALHASTFQTGFHEEDNTDTRRFSIGTYIYPDTSFDNLIDFAKEAQAQTRKASIYQHVDDWADGAWMGLFDNVTVVTNRDVDLDGEAEYILHNDRVFALFERIGGRMIGAWVRDLLTHRVYHAAGNLVSFTSEETEEEGNQNTDGSGNIVAFRTSGFKDWFSTKGGGTSQYVNNLYTVTAVANGWQLVSADGHITKTITLAPKSWKLEAAYQLDSNDSLYVRHGFSPDLFDLLLRGQETLGPEAHAGGVMTLSNTNYEETVSARVGYGDAGHTTHFNPAAIDDNPGVGATFYTRNMRNQAQTHQVEIFGTNNFAFAVEFRAQLSDWDKDGMPNVFEDNQGFDASDPSDGSEDDDGDGVKNSDEYVAGTDLLPPGGSNEYPQVNGVAVMANPGITLQFPTENQRFYYIYYSNDDLVDPAWLLATSNGIPGTGGVEDWTDDGAGTSPHPVNQTNRAYKIEVGLPK